MSSSYTLSETQTFTATHARHLASKVATDLKRMQRFYGRPSDPSIAEYEAELVELLKAGYLRTVTYGFQRSAKWVCPTLRYTAYELVNAGTQDDDPGRVRLGCDVEGASCCSFLTYNDTWYCLSEEAKRAFKATLPIRRTAGLEAGTSGYFVRDKSYSSGGRSIGRDALRSW